MDTARGYTGQYADTLTGLDYYVSRYYDPVAGIFLSADVKEGNAAGMNPYAYVAGNPETMADPSGQYYSNGIPQNQPGGETAYVYGNVVATVTNGGAGIFYPLYGPASWNYGSLSVNVSTNDQFARYGSYNSANDPQYSTAAKFAAVTGWTQLQQSWNAPGANTASRLAALGKFAGTNVNNVLQLAAIFSGPEDDGVAVAADEVGTTVAQETGSVLYRVLRSDEEPALGLFPKDPGANQPVIDHILQGSRPWFKSQFISTTNDLGVATKWAIKDGLRIAEIDSTKVVGNVIDVSTREALEQYGITYPSFAYSWARSSSEVLIEGSVPAEAITCVFLP